MKNFIQMFKGKSSTGNAIYSSVKRMMTEFGSMYQGTPRGQSKGLPWFISITEWDADKCPEVIWANTQDGEWLTEAEYKDRFLSSGTADDDTTTDQPANPAQGTSHRL